MLTTEPHFLVINTSFCNCVPDFSSSTLQSSGAQEPLKGVFWAPSFIPSSSWPWACSPNSKHHHYICRWYHNANGLARGEDVRHLAEWSSNNSLVICETIELIVYFRKSKSSRHTPIYMTNTAVDLGILCPGVITFYTVRCLGMGISFLLCHVNENKAEVKYIKCFLSLAIFLSLFLSPLLSLHLFPALRPTLSCYCPFSPFPHPSLLSISHMHNPFYPHPHGDALQADNKSNVPSASAD